MGTPEVEGRGSLEMGVGQRRVKYWTILRWMRTVYWM